MATLTIPKKRKGCVKASAEPKEIVVKKYRICETENTSIGCDFEGEFHFPNAEAEQRYRKKLQKEYQQFLDNPLILPHFFVGQ